MFHRAVVVAFLAAAVGCSPAEPQQPPDRSAPREDASSTLPRLVLLISIDTLRPDHLGAYGYERPTSPVMDALGREGVVFEEAISTAPWTLPAHASMLTGMYPERHGATSFARAVSEHLPTLATTLRDRGFATAAVVNTTHLKPQFGATQGFEKYRYIEESVDRVGPSTWVTDQAIEWLQALRDRQAFLFVHYYDVHASYFSLPRYERMFATPYAGMVDGSGKQIYSYLLDEDFVAACREDPERQGCRTWIADPEFATTERIEFDEADLRHLIELYDAGVRQMDAELARLVDFLRREELIDETLLILTSDHGDEFLEHGGFLHSRDQYQEVLRVPLIIRGPGVRPGARVATPVSLVDIVPTVLGMLAIEPTIPIDGIDLSPLFSEAGANGDCSSDAGDPLCERPLFAEASSEGLVVAVRRGRYKLHYDRVTGSEELYDLESDPDEQDDIASREPGVAAELRELLDARLGTGVQGRQVELSPEDTERLRALGYLD